MHLSHYCTLDICLKTVASFHVKMLCLFWVYYLVLYVKLGQESLVKEVLK